MRQLTSKQKKLLDQWRINQIFKDADDIPTHQWAQLQEINDTEILYQEVNRYLNDN